MQWPCSEGSRTQFIGWLQSEKTKYPFSPASGRHLNSASWFTPAEGWDSSAISEIIYGKGSPQDSKTDHGGLWAFLSLEFIKKELSRGTDNENLLIYLKIINTWHFLVLVDIFINLVKALPCNAESTAEVEEVLISERGPRAGFLYA